MNNVNKCQCVTNNGVKCTRDASKKEKMDKRFCWQHQNCVLSSQKQKSPSKTRSKSPTNTEIVIGNKTLVGLPEVDLKIVNMLNFKDLKILLKTNNYTKSLAIKALPNIIDSYYKKKEKMNIDDADYIDEFALFLFVHKEFDILKYVLDLTKNYIFFDMSLDHEIYRYLSENIEIYNPVVLQHFLSLKPQNFDWEEFHQYITGYIFDELDENEGNKTKQLKIVNEYIPKLELINRAADHNKLQDLAELFEATLEDLAELI